MRVWIDQDLCTGDGLCEEICPEIFRLGPDGLAFVHNRAPGEHPGRGAAGAVDVPLALADAVLDAADECPGECIFVDA